jgi:CBS domain-containing protein
MQILVKDFMKTPVVTTVLNSEAGYVRELMERKDVNAIPVVALNGAKAHLKGIVTSTDLRGLEDESTLVEDIMTSNVLAIDKNADAKAAAALMLKHSVHHLVVMEEEEIVGMLSSLDFVKLVAENW